MSSRFKGRHWKNVRYTIRNRTPHWGPHCIIVTSQSALNVKRTSAFGFGPFDVLGWLVGHYNAMRTSVGCSISYITWLSVSKYSIFVSSCNYVLSKSLANFIKHALRLRESVLLNDWLIAVSADIFTCYKCIFYICIWKWKFVVYGHLCT